MRAEIMIDGKWQPFAEGGIYTGGDIPVLSDRGEVYIPTRIAPFECTGRITRGAEHVREGIRRAVDNGIRALIADLIDEHGTYGMGHA